MYSKRPPPPGYALVLLQFALEPCAPQPLGSCILGKIAAGGVYTVKLNTIQIKLHTITLSFYLSRRKIIICSTLVTLLVIYSFAN